MVTLFNIGKRDGSRGRKASDPIPATISAGRVAGLHLVSNHGQVSFHAFALLLFWQFSQGMGMYMQLSKPYSKWAIRTAILLGTTAALLGCGGGKSEPVTGAAPANVTTQTASSDASKLCAFTNDEEATKCVSGQIALFVPERWGNEQYPIIYAAKYCDFHSPIVHTNGAVSCVFFKGRTVVQTDAPAEPQPPASTPSSGG